MFKPNIFILHVSGTQWYLAVTVRHTISAQSNIQPSRNLPSPSHRNLPPQTAHFLRSLYVHRTTPIHFLIIGDTVGIQTLVEVMADRLRMFPRAPADELRLWNMDTSERSLQIFSWIHPHTKQRHPRLFVKVGCGWGLGLRLGIELRFRVPPRPTIPRHHTTPCRHPNTSPSIPPPLTTLPYQANPTTRPTPFTPLSSSRTSSSTTCQR